MKISELTASLEKFRQRLGDVDVMLYDYDMSTYIPIEHIRTYDNTSKTYDKFAPIFILIVGDNFWYEKTDEEL